MRNSKTAAPNLIACPTPPRRCFGREREVASVVACFEQASRGAGAFVLVTGDSGVGKSAFLADAQRRLRDAGALVVEARCRRGLPSYQPVIEVVRAAVEQLRQEGCAFEVAERASALLETLAGRRAASADGDDLAARRLGFFDELSELLREMAGIRTLALCFHDLDCADRGTLEVVRYLARALTSRPELANHSFRGLLIGSASERVVALPDPAWASSVQLLQIDLRGLDAAGVRAYFSSDEVVQQLLQRTGGVPRLLESLVWRKAELGPPSPFSDLAAPERRVLELLAVFGRPIGPETLRLLSGLPGEQLARSTAVLAEQALIEKIIARGELRLGFARSGDQRAVYEMLPAATRRELHAAIGAYLESHGDAELEACAEHLLLGGCGARAARMALLAGQRLESGYGFERAAELYERALAEVDALPLRQTLLEKLCATCEIIGQLERALEHAAELRRQRPGDFAAGLRLARLHRLRGDYAAARAELARLQELDASQAGPSLELQARLQAEAAETQLLSGETGAALASAARGLLLCASGEGPHLRRALLALQNTLGKIHLEKDQLEEASLLFQRNLELARSAGFPVEETLALAQLGLVHLRRGECAESQHCYEQAIELAVALRDLRMQASCEQNLAVLEERRGNLREALHRYQEAVGLFKKVGHRTFLAWVGLDLGSLYLGLGDLDRARAMLDLADRLTEKVPEPDRLPALRVNLDLLRASILRRERRLQESRQHLLRARGLAVAAGQSERATRVLLELASLELERDEPAAALQALEEARCPEPNHLRLRALLLRGRTQTALQQLGPAEEQLAEALALAAGLPDPERAWQVQLALAGVARAQGRRSDERRWLAQAAAGEEQARNAIPEEFWPLLADQPPRAKLREALGQVEARPARRGPAPTLELLPLQPAAHRYGPIIGGHRRMQQIYEHLEKVAATDATVMIRGESGTGKELIAEAVHRKSKRASKPLVKVNCGALVESLLLSELFGHERGAFTGATARKKGRFEVAEGGTIFLDEIGDISPKTQVALLRVLQEREFERVGGTSPVKVNVRVICATNRDLEKMVARGEFREDLYYRLNGVRLEVPPLRERQEDIAPLAEHLLDRIGRERDSLAKRLTPAAEQLLQRYGWPGNVRELENVLRSVSLFADSDLLDVADFADYPELQVAVAVEEEPAAVEAAAAAPQSPYHQVRSLGWSLRDYKKHIEVECIKQALQEAEGNITRAAELLGMKRPRLSQLIKEHGIALAERSEGVWS